jgi:hypothetical protein
MEKSNERFEQSSLWFRDSQIRNKRKEDDGGDLVDGADSDSDCREAKARLENNNTFTNKKNKTGRRPLSTPGFCHKLLSIVF